MSTPFAPRQGAFPSGLPPRRTRVEDNAAEVMSAIPSFDDGDRTAARGDANTWRLVSEPRCIKTYHLTLVEGRAGGVSVSGNRRSSSKDAIHASLNDVQAPN